MLLINQLRTYYRDRTVGEVYVNGMRQGTTLEDTGRPDGIKVPKETCIPEGIYHVAITHSPRFKRDMIILYNTVNDYSIRSGSMQWTGVRVHSGVDIEHTEACILFGSGLTTENKLIGGGLPVFEQLIRDELNKSGAVRWIIGRWV